MKTPIPESPAQVIIFCTRPLRELTIPLGRVHDLDLTPSPSQLPHPNCGLYPIKRNGFVGSRLAVDATNHFKFIPAGIPSVLLKALWEFLFLGNLEIAGILTSLDGCNLFIYFFVNPILLSLTWQKRTSFIFKFHLTSHSALSGI